MSGVFVIILVCVVLRLQILFLILQKSMNRFRKLRQQGYNNKCPVSFFTVSLFMQIPINYISLD